MSDAHDTQQDHGDHPGDHRGHDKHEGHDPEAFRRLFWWNLLLAIPVLLFSGQVQEWAGYSIDGAWAAWVAPTVGTVIYLWGGRPFLDGARREVADRQPGMMLLIALAISVAFASSLAGSLGLGELDFWWELAGLIVIMLLGHWKEMQAIGQAKGALGALAELLPDDAEVVREGRHERVPVSELRVADVVLVRPGGRIPADGRIVDGEARIDESMITGESRPVRRSVDDRVVAGTVSTDSSIRVELDAIGDDTALAGIHRMVEEAQTSKSRSQDLADRAAALLFYVAVGVAVVTMAAWTLLGSPDEGVIRTVTVLVVACPHALGLAIPLVIAISTATAAEAGILVKRRAALERMRTIDTVLFDKTGTLTMGKHAVVDAAGSEGHDADEMLGWAAAAERDSEHPVARAIIRSAADRGLDAPEAGDFEALTGRGVTADVEGARLAVGGPAMLDHLGLGEPDDLQTSTRRWRDEGGSVLFVVRDRVVVGALTLADEIRPESEAAVQELHDRDREVAMITGDAHQVADAVAGALGIDEVIAEVLPEDKDGRVGDLRDRGRSVAMVGDGVNDAPALARADVGIAIGAGTDVAIEAADVVLASSDPRAVVSTIDLSQASYRKMLQNLVWATAYNLIALPIAAGAFEFAGLVLPPAVAALAMSASTIIVAANAQLLRRIDLRPAEAGGGATKR